MSMKTRSQTGSDNENSEENPPPIPPETNAAPIVVTSDARIEVNENSQAFRDALDRALIRLIGSRDDAANFPAVYATGDIAVRTDQPYGDQSSSRNPLDRVSATIEPLRNLLIGELSSVDRVEKNLANEGYRENSRNFFSIPRNNDVDSSSNEEDAERTSKSDRARKNSMKERDNELHDASRKSSKKSDKSSRRSSNKSSNKTSNNDNVDSPRNEADLVSGR
jgi:hypothetical protein